ncbi:MAG TPA: response regulator transcription factor [Gemmatimonadales bacterium]|nr:response regulator transcription factor [Gemmatimonadales bacterium]
MIKVFIADDRPVFREGLKSIMEESRDMALVTEQSAGDQFLDAAHTAQADVLLLGDVSVPTSKILDVIRAHHQAGSKLKILVLGMQDDDEYAVRLLRAGADGYLSKDHSAAQLLEAIRRVAGGRRYVSPRLAQKLVFDVQVSETARPQDALSDREYQVLSMFCSGKSFRAIAEELGLSSKTVGTYRRRIMQKLHLKSNAALIRFGIENSLVE